MSIEVLKDASDELISHLSYKNPNTASYIIDRNSSSFHAVGGDKYAPTSGVRVIRFNISSEDFLDPNSLRIQFDIVNDDPNNKTLYPIGGPHGFFSRARLLSRGTVVEDITQYNRVHEMLSLLKSAASVQDDSTESFLMNDYNKSSTLTKELSGIPQGQRMTVLFKPIFGVLNQPKYISLKYSPLTIELELDNDELANIVTPLAEANYNGSYSEAATSKVFNIQNCIVRCDIIKVDSELMNKYDDHFMSGGFINLRYTTYHSQIMKIIGPPSFNVNLSRALTYLTRIYATFIKASTVGTGGNPADFWMKSYNTFYHSLRKYNRVLPLANPVPDYRKVDDMVQSAQIQIGSKLFPDYPIRSSTEAYYFLKKAFNLNTVFHNHIHSLNIKAKEYLDHKFVMVFDTEMVNGHVAAFTGRNVKNGEQITLKMQLQDNTALAPEDVHIVLEAEQILEIRGTYVRTVD